MELDQGFVKLKPAASRGCYNCRFLFCVCALIFFFFFPSGFQHTARCHWDGKGFSCFLINIISVLIISVCWFSSRFLTTVSNMFVANLNTEVLLSSLYVEILWGFLFSLYIYTHTQNFNFFATLIQNYKIWNGFCGTRGWIV